MTTVPTVFGSTPSARSCAGIESSVAMRMSLNSRPPHLPRAFLGSTATDGCSPVSTSTSPAVGWRTRNATTGMSTRSSSEVRATSVFSEASRPSGRSRNPGAQCMRAQISGCNCTETPFEPPGNGRFAGCGSAAVAAMAPDHRWPPGWARSHKRARANPARR